MKISRSGDLRGSVAQIGDCGPIEPEFNEEMLVPYAARYTRGIIDAPTEDALRSMAHLKESIYVCRDTVCDTRRSGLRRLRVLLPVGGLNFEFEFSAE